MWGYNVVDGVRRRLVWWFGVVRVFLEVGG